MIVISPSGSIRDYPGDLFQLPIELRSFDAYDNYLDLENPGWHETYMGYRSFVSVDPHDATIYIFPSLRIRGHRKKCEPIAGYEAVFEEKDIEIYAESAISIRRELRAEIEQDANILVHDLRKLNTSVYHKALACKTNLQSGNLHQASYDIENALAAIELLRLRTDTLDLTSNLERRIPKKSLKSYGKVREVVEAFNPNAIQKDIRLNISQPFPNMCKTHDLYQLIPYIIIDNAIKYSPRGHEIHVFHEINDGMVTWNVKSVGPLIEPQESPHILERGRRGYHALKSGVPGSGYGLFLANLLLRRCDGKLSHQSTEMYEDTIGVLYAENIFSFSVPLFTSKPSDIDVKIKYS